MKYKYLIGILCVCVLMSVTGCSSDADANAQIADNVKTSVALPEDDQEEETSAALPEDDQEEETSAVLPEDNQEEDTEGFDDEESIVLEGEEYSNPIDAYFLPRIEHASCEAERRQMQDTYRGVWKTEFENIMAWMQDKCVYQEDKDTLVLYEESVESLIETTRTISLTKDKYEFPPGSNERNSWGNGTRSELNQKEAEIYRNAGMELIDDTYIFMERDYSMELYE